MTLEDPSPGAGLIFSYFPRLSSAQKERLKKLYPVYAEWNSRINVISRKDITAFYQRHVLHSLAVHYSPHFLASQTVIDIGTGGGFPAIPLAILHPDKEFLLVDSIDKKMKVCRRVADALQLPNVQTQRGRAEKIQGRYDVAITRAVAPLKVLTRYTMNSKMQVNYLLCLKGGDLSGEIGEVINKCSVKQQPLSRFFNSPFFNGKALLEVTQKAASV